MEIVENALSSTADTDANLEAELAVDTDAVTSAVPWEQRKVGEVLSNAEGGPSPLFRVLQLVTALVPILLPIVRVDGYAAAANMERPNELLQLFGVLMGCSFALLLLALGSARIALQLIRVMQSGFFFARPPWSHAFYGRGTRLSHCRASLKTLLRACV